MNVDDIKKLSITKIKDESVLFNKANRIMFDKIKTNIILIISLNDVYRKKKLYDFDNISNTKGIKINNKTTLILVKVEGLINKKVTRLNVI